MRNTEDSEIWPDNILVKILLCVIFVFAILILDLACIISRSDLKPTK